MHDSAPEVAKQVALLAESLRSVEARLAVLEKKAALEAAPAPASPRPSFDDPRPAATRVPETGAASLPAVLGRCLFVLAGAFLVRAVTDSGTLPHGTGVALGLAYAFTWLAVADRAGRARPAAGAADSTGATAWGITALVIACPLVWEASTRFAVMQPAGAAGVLLAVTLAALAASVRRNLKVLAWTSVLSAVVTAFALLVSTRAAVVFAAFLVVLTAVAWAASVRSGWSALPWAPAAAADLVVLELIWIASRPEGLPEAYQGLRASAVLALAVALMAAPLAEMARRARGRAGTPDAFEAAQTGAALFVVVFAASHLDFAAGLPPALVWGLAGLAAAAAPARVAWAMAPAYGAVLLLTAALVSGLVLFAGRAFVGPAPAGGPSVHVVLVLLLALLATALLMRRAREDAGARIRRAATIALACLSMTGMGALAAWGLARLVASDGDPGRTASARSAVLAAVAVLLASFVRLPALSALARLAWPLLAFGALKLLLEDLPHGRASTLVVTFVLYGAALMIVPGILRSRRT